MSTYKIHKGADGRVKSFGANVPEFQPFLEDGDTIEYADALPPLTSAQLFAALRAARDARLAATDKMLLPDYPISVDALAGVKTYRAALRDLPDQPGAPWDGGGEATPWPAAPAAPEDTTQAELSCA